MFKKYIAGISGGPDSMALLSKYKFFISAVCIVNYMKRESANFDVKCVVDYCKLHNIKYYVLNVDKKVYKKYENIENFQNKARIIRYDFFSKIGNEIGVFNLLIAHNLDDFLETAYMQREKKSKALFYGIKAKSNYQNLKIYRPLIGIRKDTLKRYCYEKDIKFGIDETNELEIYERNKIRKLLKTWSSDEIFAFLNEIKKYNKNNKKKIKEIECEFARWRMNQFSLFQFNSYSDDIKYYLIYNLLKENLEKNKSSHKINSLIIFLKENRGNKKFRLENNKSLYIDKKIVKIS